MKQELREFIRIESAEEGAFTAEFRFPASFSGFSGHFPDQPVLPGVCLIQAVLVATEMALGREAALTEIVFAKFIAITQPDEILTAVCKVNDDMVRAKISSGEERVAEIRLRVDYV